MLYYCVERIELQIKGEFLTHVGFLVGYVI